MEQMKNNSSNYKSIFIFIAILFLPVIFWLFSKISFHKNQTQTINENAIIVAEKNDPYYSLAEKISLEENLKIATNFSDIFQTNPKYVILVSSPEKLTGNRLYKIGSEFSANDYYPALGIITGSTQELAEQLWRRKNLVRNGNNYLAGDTDIWSSIYEPTIIDISEGAKNETINLNKNSLISSLQKANYIYWSRHSGVRTWYWNEGKKDWGENDQLASKDIPKLLPVVIYSPTCKIFRPWEKDSIVLKFVDQGAAAYLGFLNSPNAKAFLEYDLFVPGINSWEEFPLGIIAQIGNKAATKAIFNSPQFFMMGDPRIYLTKDQPYQINFDTIDKKGNRVIKGESDKKGLLPIKIENGSRYSFTHIHNLGSISDSDPFYNSKAQSLNLGENKYISFLHHGGEFEFLLSPKTPVLWSIKDIVFDVFDYSWVVLWLDNYSDAVPYIDVLSIPALIVILLFKQVKQKKHLGNYKSIFLVSLFLVFTRAGYFLIRFDDYTVIANTVSFTLPKFIFASLGVFCTTAGGLILMKDAKTKLVFILGLLLAISRQLWMTAFRFIFNTILSIVPSVSGMTQAWVWNYTDFWLRYTVLIIEIIIVLIFYRLVTRSKRLA